MQVTSVLPNTYSSGNQNQGFSFKGYSEVYARSIKEVRNVKNRVDIEKIYNNLLKNAMEESGAKPLKGFDIISSEKPLEGKLQDVYNKSLTIKDNHYEIPLVKNGEKNVVSQLLDMVRFIAPNETSGDIRFGKNYKGDMFVSSCNGKLGHYTMTVSKKIR